MFQLGYYLSQIFLILPRLHPLHLCELRCQRCFCWVELQQLRRWNRHVPINHIQLQVAPAAQAWRSRNTLALRSPAHKAGLMGTSATVDVKMEGFLEKKVGGVSKSTTTGRATIQGFCQRSWMEPRYGGSDVYSRLHVHISSCGKTSPTLAAFRHRNRAGQTGATLPNSKWL